MVEDRAESAEAVGHEIRGVGEETRVDCPKHQTIYGPHPDAISEFNYCPYCGNDADADGHDQSLVEGEIMCDYSGMSTYRYCPGCGTEVSDT